METVTEHICMGGLIVLGWLILIFGGPKLLGAAMIAGENAIYDHDRAAALETIRQDPEAYCFYTVQGEMYSDGQWTFTRDQVYGR